MGDKEQYFNYLKQRSVLGSIYRKYFLYPKLNHYLKGSMLDIGCGIGDMLAFRAHSIGVDVNEFNVEFCKLRGLDAYQMPLNTLPFLDGRFDSILLDNVLEHIEDPLPLLTEIKRVMRTNGALLIGVPGVKGYASDSDHKVFYDESRLAELATKAGFSVNVSLHTPLWKCNLFSTLLKQYCIYTLWISND